jgi:bifunctional non-homologous end joining protein LigD
MPASKTERTAPLQRQLKENFKRGSKSPFPKDLQPMLATLVNEPFEEPGWLYEVKWDGYRTLIYSNKGSLDLKSRNNKSFNQKFYTIYDALKEWKVNAVLDGEIIAIDESGVSQFSNLQGWRSEADGELVLYVFDLLWLEGYNLMTLPLTERKKILKTLLPDLPMIRLSESFEAGALDFFEAAKKLHIEGIIAKKKDSLYVPGMRSVTG